MINYNLAARVFKEKLSLNYLPVGLYYSSEKPAEAGGFKKAGSGCIMPMIFASAKGKTVAFGKESTGWPCSAYYLGFNEWIFPGIENYLADGPMPGRECERFVKSSALAKKAVESFKAEPLKEGYAVFKPLENFNETEIPEAVIFFANADEISALASLIYFVYPLDEDRVIARFASACAAVSALPVKYAEGNINKAVWGMHDIAARTRLPKELMTLAMPRALFDELYKSIEDTFVNTSNWNTIQKRNIKTV